MSHQLVKVLEVKSATLSSKTLVSTTHSTHQPQPAGRLLVVKPLPYLQNPLLRSQINDHQHLEVSRIGEANYDFACIYI